jgi:hypothetical protein
MRTIYCELIRLRSAQRTHSTHLLSSGTTAVHATTVTGTDTSRHRALARSDARSVPRVTAEVITRKKTARGARRAAIFSFLVSIILHPSYIAYGTSAIFSTTSMAYIYALASILYCEILLAVLPLPSRHGFRAQRPPTFLSLLCCITSSHLATLHHPFSLSVSLVKPLNVPRVNFVVFGYRPVAYFGLLHEFEHVHYSIACNQDSEVSSVWRFADCDVFGFQLLHHGLPFPAPLSIFEQEVRDGLSAAVAPPPACVLGFCDPRWMNGRDCVT